MLSIVDLIERKTVNIDLASYLLVAIYEGSSFLCGALKGGVGKTALMGALLGLVPSGEKIITIESPRMVECLLQEKRDLSGECYVVHEIGSGSWFGYLWGPPVLDYMALKGENTRIASNIHADTYDQVMNQVTSFGGEASDLNKFDLILFISLTGKRVGDDRDRIVNQVLEVSSTEVNAHQPIFESRRGKIDHLRAGTHGQNASKLALAGDFLDRMLDEKILLVDEVMEELKSLHEKFQEMN